MPHRNDPGIDIIDLSNAKIVQKNFTVLNDVDLHIKKGKFCYLIGKTGSGKSSSESPLRATSLQGGSGQVAGFDLKKLKQSDVPNLRRKLGIVFQDFQLLPDRNIEKIFFLSSGNRLERQTQNGSKN
jgi:cell division transport system ATP-binding protein